MKGLRNPLIYLNYKLVDYYKSTTVNYEDLRQDERNYFSYDDNAIAIYDKRYDTTLNAILSIFRTIFVCLVLTIGALYFSKDANELVLVPIDNMLAKVKEF